MCDDQYSATMDIMDNFVSENWTKGDPNDDTGFSLFRIVKVQPSNVDQQAMYAVFDDDGDLKRVAIDGAANKDPLRGVSNAFLKLSEDGHKILGIIIEDDCLLFNGK
ncbi:hypothetical protein LSAT2_016838 [Lamellibrachia satsuma]|nr:hypothetical protein LSAT2_016838 [Lamellibrachia satsuma]